MIELFNSFRDALYHVLTFFQELVEPLMGSQSYWFAIVMLTVAVRILLIPLTVKQVDQHQGHPGARPPDQEAPGQAPRTTRRS